MTACLDGFPRNGTYAPILFRDPISVDHQAVPSGPTGDCKDEKGTVCMYIRHLGKRAFKPSICSTEYRTNHMFITCPNHTFTKHGAPP